METHALPSNVAARPRKQTVEPGLLRQPPRLLAALVLAVAVFGSMPAGAEITDISNAPIASSSSMSVLPNIMFLLDDSGSMTFDALPDHTERQQGGSERRYWHQVHTCKPKGILTESDEPALDNLPANHCDRGEPPLNAVQHNGMFYNPQYTYRPAIKHDGTSYPKQTSWNAVSCDPFGTGWGCDKWYYINQDYYNNGDSEADAGQGDQRYTNGNVKQWYGSSSTFDVQTRFPEIVFCSTPSGNANTESECRRNGTTTASIGTGNPFRYSTAASRTGYPEAPSVSEFWRQEGNTTITVTSPRPHAIVAVAASANFPAFSAPFQIIPGTGTGTATNGLDYRTGGAASANTCSGNTCTVTVSSPYQFTYKNERTGQKVAHGAYDLIVPFNRQSGTVYVTSPAHGLITGDTIRVFFPLGGPGGVTCHNNQTRSVTVTNANIFSFAQNCSGSNGTASGYWRKEVWFNIPKIRQSNPVVYTIESVEHCKDTALTDCTASTTPTGAYIHPAPLRYCLSHFDANRLDSFVKNAANDHLERGGTRPRCRKKYEEATGYIYPRYGQFRRTDITAAGTYNGRPLRSDCASRPTCSGSEEMTNFANWFAYYRTRMLSMKTAAGLAFSPIGDRYRVGFLTINPTNGDPDDGVQSDAYLKIATFTPAHKQAWYEKFYDKNNPGGTTPLPLALSRVGRHFAGKKNGINNGMGDDPVQYSCQQNFALVTTDGYWVERRGQDENAAAIGNVDNNATQSPRPFYDGGTPYNPASGNSAYGSSGTLADVALYYYQTDLRPGGSIGALGTDVSENNVPSREDPNSPTSAKTSEHQHMVTFGLGMAEGLMDWQADYESKDSTGDFDDIRDGSLDPTRCVWRPSGACNWPMVGERTPSALDDLWHAAVNGRGKFFYARDTQAMQDGLNGALTSLQERNASGAAAATSTPNITPSDRGIFKTSYTTVKWNGEIIAQLIDPNDGSVLPGVLWSAKDKLQNRVGPDTDNRTIYVADYGVSNGIKAFQYAGLDATKGELDWFQNKCAVPTNLSQCTLLDPTTELPLVNDGQNMVNFLRGQTQHELKIFRDRQFALGDTVNAVPLYISKPRLAFGDAVTPTYLDWGAQSSIKNRTPALYVGANDGMLHAFNANSGDEMWAFIPRQVAPNLWKLAERNYANKHLYFVDGSPATMDVYDGSTWRTILVGGLNAGGRGYYALDVTNPSAPGALWEFCSDATLCSESDPNMGYSFGNPVITKRAYDGRWVVLVTSGYNNVTPGDGKGYLYVLDALTGKKLGTPVSTGAGSTATPSGLGKISAWADNYAVDNTSKAAYGGDLEGNIWKFDLTKSPAGVMLLAQARDASDKPQPITTRPELGLVDETYKAVFVGTGRYLGQKDLTDPAVQTPAGTSAWNQSIYAFKDKDSALGNLRNAANKLVMQTITQVSGGQSRTVSRNAVNWATDNGWYVDLNPGNTSPGERVNVDPQLALGTLIVTTNVPLSNACSIGGDSWIYQFDYRNGSYVAGAPSNLLARKQTGALTVGMVVYQLQKGSIIGQVQRSETSMRKEDINIAPGTSPSRRTSWREIIPTGQ